MGVGSTPSPTWCGGPPSHAPHTLGARVVGGLRHPAAAQGEVSSGRFGSSRCCGCRGHQACLGGSPECVWHISRVSGGLERENRISEAAIEPPRAGFDACGGCTVLGLHGELPGILISILGQPRPSLYGSGSGRVSIAQPSRSPFFVRPAALCPPQSEERLRPDREGTGTTREPRRAKGPVIGNLGHGDRPAVAFTRSGLGP